MFTIGSWLSHRVGWYGAAVLISYAAVFGLVILGQCVWEGGR